MFARYRRWLSAAALPFLLLAAAGRAPALAGAAPAPAGAPGEGRLAARMAADLHHALRDFLKGALARASRSERVDLELGFSLVDDRQRMLFDINGTVRVAAALPGAAARIDEQIASKRTRLWRSDGPISIDLAVTPLARVERDVTYAVQLDVAVLTHRVAGLLLRNTAQLGASLGLHALAHQVHDFVHHLHLGHAGDALALAIEEGAHVAADVAVGVPYEAYQSEATAGVARRLRRAASGHHLLHHVGLAALYTGATAGMKVAATSAGGVIAAVLAPKAAGIGGLIVAAAPAVWFGNWVVRKVAVEIPMHWSLARLGRLHRRVAKLDDDEHAARIQAKIDAITGKLAGGIGDDLAKKHDRWTRIQLLVQWFEKRLAADRHDTAFDLTPYQGLIDEVMKLLAHETLHGDDWYASRTYYQLKRLVER